VVEAEACLFDFRPDLLWAMEVGRGEPLWTVRRILMDPVHQIALDDRLKRCIPERAFLDTIAGRSETRNVR
jgi:hypothetical protein